MYTLLDLPPEVRWRIWELVYRLEEFRVRWSSSSQRKRYWATYLKNCTTLLDQPQREYPSQDLLCRRYGKCTLETCRKVEGRVLELPRLCKELRDEICRALWKFSLFSVDELALEQFLKALLPYQLNALARLRTAIQCFEPDGRPERCRCCPTRALTNSLSRELVENNVSLSELTIDLGAFLPYCVSRMLPHSGQEEQEADIRTLIREAEPFPAKRLIVNRLLYLYPKENKIFTVIFDASLEEISSEVTVGTAKQKSAM